MLGMFIYYPDLTPATDTTGWITQEVGIWHIGPNLTKVHVCAPPQPPLSAAEAEGIRDAEFIKMRHRGLSVIPYFSPAAGRDFVTR